MNVLKKIKKYKPIIFSILILLVLAILGFSYAYYNANVTVVSETQTIIRSKKLALTFNDTKEVNVDDMIPGKSVEKTFNVVSAADDTVTYNIKWKDITSTYNEDLVYMLYRDGEVLVQQTPMPKTNPEEYILTNISIDPEVTHDYVLKIEFLYTDEPQGGGKALEFNGTVEIDVEKIDNELIYLPYITDEINSNEATEENAITNEFIVRNTSATDNQTYNVLLEDIENEYEDGELSYSLTKNGEEVSSGDISSEAEIVYLSTGVDMNVGSTDGYELTISENVNEELISYKKERYVFSLLSNEIAASSLSKNFSAKIVVNTDEVDSTKPECDITGLPEDWTTKAVLEVNATDNESGLATKAYSRDGFNYTSSNTLEITSNGTYTVYVKDKVGNVQTCSASVSKIDTTEPETSTIAINNFSGTTVTLGLSGTDPESGISKYVVKYGTSASALTNEKTVTTTENSATTTIEVTHGSTVYIQVDVYNGTGSLYKSSDIISKTFNAYYYYTTSSSIDTTLVSTGLASNCKGSACALSTCTGYGTNYYSTIYYTTRSRAYGLATFTLSGKYIANGVTSTRTAMKVTRLETNICNYGTQTKTNSFQYLIYGGETYKGAYRTYVHICAPSTNGRTTYVTWKTISISGKISYTKNSTTISANSKGYNIVTSGWSIATTLTTQTTSSNLYCKGSACSYLTCTGYNYTTLYRTDPVYETYTTCDKNISATSGSYFTTSYKQE